MIASYPIFRSRGQFGRVGLIILLKQNVQLASEIPNFGNRTREKKGLPVLGELLFFPLFFLSLDTVKELLPNIW